MYDYNCPDCNEAKLQSDKNARKINEIIGQVNQIVDNDIATTEYLLKKADEIVGDATDKHLDNINSKLNNKADKNEVFSMANMGQDIKTAMTGGSVAVVGRNAILTENIVDGQIIPCKLDYYTNIIDKNNVEHDKAISIGTFLPTTLSGYSITDYIPVTAGDYVINFFAYDTIFIFNNNKEKIDFINTKTDQTTFKIEQDGYIRLVIPSNKLDIAMCHRGTIISNEYIPYGYIKWLQLKENNFSDMCVPNSALKIDYKFLETLKGYIKRINLFNPSVATDGKIISYPVGNLTDNEDFLTSDFIEVESGEYTLNIANYDTVFLYDYSKNLVDKISLDGWGIEANTITIDNNIKYIRVSCLLTYKDSIMIVKGNELPNTYVSYDDIYIPNLVINQDNNKTLKGTFLFSGDSICEAPNSGGYCQLIKENNPNANCINYAISGTTIAKQSGKTNSILERIETMQSEADYIILEGGVNDAWASSIEIGEFDPNSAIGISYINNLNEYTFSGALESLFNKAQNKWQGKKIFFIIPHNTDLPNTKSYMDRAEHICQKWGVILIDLRKLSGLNPYNEYMKNTYFNNADGVHPNKKGYEEFYLKPITDILLKYQ